MGKRGTRIIGRHDKRKEEDKKRRDDGEEVGGRDKDIDPDTYNHVNHFKKPTCRMDVQN